MSAASDTVRWAGHLDEGDSLRFWLPIVVPGAAVTFTLLAAISWWYSAFNGAEFGAQTRDVSAVVLTVTVTVTTIGMFGLWLLPPTLSPRLRACTSRRG
ncbi:hypothetical protein [Streptomyces sp. NPDC057557]|uniref:hypothetical protein n=1 Tax=Streptomyces sp. NPDC057557 TaxID=3346167 RepID=UPI0036C39A90